MTPFTKTAEPGPVTRALAALAEPLPDRALVLDDDGGWLSCDLAGRGVNVTTLLGSDRQAAKVHDLAVERDVASKVDIRVGDPLGPWGIAPQRSLFELRDEAAGHEARLFEGRPWPLVIVDVTSAGLTSAERRRLRPWFEAARGNFPREVVLIERAARMTGDEGRLVFACRPDLFSREFGTLLSERILAPRGPHLIVDARTADPPRIIVAQTPQAATDRAVRPRMGLPPAGRWSALVDGIRDEDHPWVDWRDIPSGLSDPADALDSQQSRDLLAAMEAGASGTVESLLGAMPGRTTACGFRDVWMTHDQDAARPLVRADGIRDWQVTGSDYVFWPYDRPGRPVDRLTERAAFRLVQHRPLLEARRIFGDTIKSRGLRWFEHAEHYPARIEAPFRVVCSTRGTHNHAALLRDSRLLTSSSNIVLPAIDETSAYLLLALLNSSLICFWTKHSVPSGQQFELTSGQLLSLPIPAQHTELLVSIGRKIDRLARQFVELEDLIGGTDPDRIDEKLEAEREHRERIEGELLWWQEELDWAVYASYNLVRRTDSDTLPHPIRRDERAFLSVAQHPGRGALIAHDSRIRAIERSNYKRPFDARDFERERSHAAAKILVERLVDRLTPGTFVPVDTLVQSLRDDSFVECLLPHLEFDDEMSWFAGALDTTALSMNPARLFAESGWIKFNAHVRRCLAATRREAGDHGESTQPIIWTRDDFASGRAWLIRGRHNVAREAIWVVDEMATFEGRTWVTRAPQTWSELDSVINGYERLLHDFGFYTPDARAEGGASAAIESTRAWLRTMAKIGDESGFRVESAGHGAGPSSSVETFRLAQTWVKEGAPAPVDPAAVQLDLDRLVGIREVVATSPHLKLRTARERLVPQGWSAREVRLALDSLVERSEVVCDGDPVDPTYRKVDA